MTEEKDIQTTEDPARCAAPHGSDFVGFETVPTELQFDCDFAVYRKGSNSSMCYVTSQERGALIVAALDAFVQSGEAEKWLNDPSSATAGPNTL